MKRAPDLRHVRIDTGARVTLLQSRRRFTDSTFTGLEDVGAGAEGVVTGSSNAGFNGLLYHLRLDDGSRLHNVPACDLVAFTLEDSP